MKSDFRYRHARHLVARLPLPLAYYCNLRHKYATVETQNSINWKNKWTDWTNWQSSRQSSTPAVWSTPRVVYGGPRPPSLARSVRWRIASACAWLTEPHGAWPLPKPGARWRNGPGHCWP